MNKNYFSRLLREELKGLGGTDWKWEVAIVKDDNPLPHLRSVHKDYARHKAFIMVGSGQTTTLVRSRRVANEAARHLA
jgi:hypothetical protein